jgi:S-adenosylmethionine hydrolase
LITLLTDFGLTDGYVGQLKAVILAINPMVNIVDLTHEIEPYNLTQSAFLLSKISRQFLPEIIHVAVVDPCVESTRRPLLAVTPKGFFLALDNGILSGVFSERSGLSKVFQINNEAYWRHPVSSTFDGREIFAPVAAHLSLGLDPEKVDDEVRDPICHPINKPVWGDGRLQGEIVHIDRFGNLITNIDRELVNHRPSLSVGDKNEVIMGLGTFYSEAEGLMALVGSFDTLEIALNHGSAAQHLKARVGDNVSVLDAF